MEVSVCNTESALVRLHFFCSFPDVLGYSWCLGLFMVFWGTMGRCSAFRV